MPSTVGYYKIRGLAAPIRMILEYVGEEYENTFYDIGPPPDYNRDSWYSVKYTLGLGSFPNVPYYMNGGRKIVESMAIINHLSRKYNLEGSTEDIRIRGDILIYHLNDVHQSFYNILLKENCEILIKEFKSTLSEKLQPFEEFLGSNTYFAGDELTKADFLAYEFFEQMCIISPGCLDNFNKLSCWKLRMESIPPIKDFLSSSRYICHPIVSPDYYDGKSLDGERADCYIQT